MNLFLAPIREAYEEHGVIYVLLEVGCLLLALGWFSAIAWAMSKVAEALCG